MKNLEHSHLSYSLLTSELVDIGFHLWTQQDEHPSTPIWSSRLHANMSCACSTTLMKLTSSHSVRLTNPIPTAIRENLSLLAMSVVRLIIRISSMQRIRHWKGLHTQFVIATRLIVKFTIADIYSCIDIEVQRLISTTRNVVRVTNAVLIDVHEAAATTHPKASSWLPSQSRLLRRCQNTRLVDGARSVQMPHSS